MLFNGFTDVSNGDLPITACAVGRQATHACSLCHAGSSGATWDPGHHGSCENTQAVWIIDVPNSHWLVDENRGVSSESPEKQQVSMMIDGIPAPGPFIFTKRTLLV